MSLNEFGKKREFSRTSEPKGKSTVKRARAIFVIQEHHAAHLHWDLRLEFEGVLKSWAVPKQPSKEHGIKRLAVQTEDHPLAYADFEGEIPEGSYGAGTVKLWDKGAFSLIEKDAKKIIVDLRGKKLKGPYCLIHTGGKKWLFFRKKA